MQQPAEIADRLNSWKQIAAHLSVSVRTAQRWEKTESLPVRRHRHATQGSVFAYKPELDAWWDSRPLLREPSHEEALPASIAVLPFVNLNRDEECEIFSDGLTEEIINALARMEGLRVVARTSAFRFKGTADDIRAIASCLGVRAVLEGSVRRAEDRLRIVAQLVNAADGCHLWSQHYDRQTRDVLDLQDEIARGIAEALRIRLTGKRIARSYGDDFETYAVYLEGRHHWNKRTGPGILAAIDCFERVLEREPAMASAWEGLGLCYLMGAYAGVPSEEALRKGRAAAQKALEIDNALVEAHASLAFASAAYEYNWSGAEARFRRALELGPNSALSHLLYAAIVLAPTGRLDQALIHQRLACELDPLSAVMAAAMGAGLLMLRRFDEAISASRKALELDPEYPWAHRWLGEACLLKGLYGEAEKAFSRIQAPVIAAGFRGYCYARTGRESQARQLLEEAMTSPGLALQVAVLHLGLGEPDLAIDWLYKSCDARGTLGVHWLNVEPIWDVLRPHPRFSGLLKRLRLTDD